MPQNNDDLGLGDVVEWEGERWIATSRDQDGWLFHPTNKDGNPNRKRRPERIPGQAKVVKRPSRPKKTINARLVSKLLEAGLTMSYIAEKCGIDQSAVRRWKDGLAVPSRKNGDVLQWLAVKVMAGGPEAEAIKAEGGPKAGKGVKRPRKEPSVMVPARVAKLLADNGWSHPTLARLVGVRPQAITHWKTGSAQPTAAATAALLRLEASPPSQAEIDDTPDVYAGVTIGPGRVSAIVAAYGWTQQQFADAIGVSRATASQWVRGVRKPTGAAVLALRKLEAEVGLLDDTKREEEA